VFAVAYVNNGTFVARDATVVVSVVLASGTRLDLHIHHAIVVMAIRGDRADNGSIGLGFTAKRIANPKRTAPLETQTDKCSSMDAGMDASID